MKNRKIRVDFLLVAFLAIISNVQAQENTTYAKSKDEIGVCRSVIFVSSVVALSTRGEDIRSSYGFRKKFLELYALGFRLEEYWDKRFSENGHKRDTYLTRVEAEWKKDSEYLVSNLDKCAKLALGLPKSKLEKQELSELCQNIGLC